MENPIQIETEFTPNPNSLKFNVSRVLLTEGSAYFSGKEEAEASPLAKKLFMIPHVEGVLIGQNFVTISRSPALETWNTVIGPVSKVIEAHLAAGEPVVLPGAKAKAPAVGGNAIEMKIRQILDERIRPAVARDGGDIIFHGFKNGVVTLHLQGACSSCPSSTATLKAGVERMLREYVPEVKEVIQV